MKTLYIHAGTPKTGTTSIQNFCKENQEPLQQKGYYYPLFPYRYIGAHALRNAHFIFGCLYKEDGSRDLSAEMQTLEDGWKHIHEAFETYDNIILSDEGLWTVGFRDEISAWEKIKQEQEKGQFAIKVIVYLRPQDEFLYSWWSQKVKEGFHDEATLDWNTMSKELPLVKINYYEMLESIAQYVGKENIIVRKFDKKDFKGGTIYEDFMNAIGLEYSDEYSIQNETRNISLTYNNNEIKRILNMVPDLSRETNLNFKNTLKQQSRNHQEDIRYSMFSQQEWIAFMEQYEEGNNRIAKEYMGLDEPLFAYQNEELTKWTPDSAYMMEDVVLFMGEMLQQMNDRLEKQARELQEQKKEIQYLQSIIRNPMKAVGKKIKRFGNKSSK